MNEFLKQLLLLSLSGTLLVLLILLLKKLYKNRFSKHWQYYIWLVVVFRFFIPFTLDITVAGTLLQTIEILSGKKIIATTNKEDLQHSENQTNAKNLQTQNSQTDKVLSQQTGKPSDSAVLHSVANLGNMPVYFIILWLVTALVILIRKILSYYRFLRYIQTAGTEVSNPETLNLLTICKKTCKVHKPVRLYNIPHIASPVMTGFFHPCIVIPNVQISKIELSFIFTHELVHYKRRDMFYKWLVQAVVCIHWFNPFIYLMEKEVNNACELSCDEAVIYSLTKEEKKAYGDTLILCSKIATTAKNSVSSITLTEGAKQLKERLGAIMNFKKRTKKTKLMTVVFTAGICLCSVIIGAYAAPIRPTQTQEQAHVSAISANTTTPYEYPANVQKILTLKIKGFEDYTLTEFSNYISKQYETNHSLWKARQRLRNSMNENIEKNMSKEDYTFLTTTLPCTESESTNPHDRVGSIPPGFGRQFQLPYPKHGTIALFEWYVQYQVKNQDITVGQRDKLILNVKNGMDAFIENTPDTVDIGTMSYLKKMRKCLDGLVEENSNSDLEMTIFKCQSDGKSA